VDRLERDVMYWRDYSPQISIVNAMQLDSINGLQGIFVLLFFFPLSRVIKFSIVHNPALDTVLSTTSQLVATGAYPFMSYSGSKEKKGRKETTSANPRVREKQRPRFQSKGRKNGGMKQIKQCIN
jgi:hypothetical protein